MKNRNIILLSFLLFLYIAPSFLAMSYSDSTILAEQNTNKDFSISDGESWYDENFHYRKLVTINYGGDAPDAGTDYQIKIPVTYNAHMQSDFDDVRFTENDGNTTLDYWRESYIASTSAVFWVEVTDYQEVGVTTSIYMYYGNSTVSTTSNGTATFLMFEDWSSQTISASRWNIVSNQGTITFSPTGATHGYIMKMDVTTANLIYSLQSVAQSTAPTALMFRSLLERGSATNQRVRQGMSNVGTSAFAVVASNYGTQEFMVMDDDTNFDYQAMDNAYFDAYYKFQITRDGTNAKLYADGSLIETGSCAPDAVSTNSALLYVMDSEKDLYSDWVALRKFIIDEPDVIGFNFEEDNLPPEPVPEWQEVGEAILIFSIPIDETALNWFLIILGMFMVPGSTLYLVKGGKNNASMDKVFYFIVAFLFGWGLIFIGVS